MSEETKMRMKVRPVHTFEAIRVPSFKTFLGELASPAEREVIKQITFWSNNCIRPSKDGNILEVKRMRGWGEPDEWMPAYVGWYIVRAGHDSYVVFKPDRFNRDYEVTSEPSLFPLETVMGPAAIDGA